MSTKAIRLFISTIALVSVATMAAPAEAAQPVKQRNVWCC